VSGLAVWVKPFVLFGLVGAFVSAALHKKGGWKRIIDPSLLVFLGILFLPIALYYGYGIFVDGFLTNQAQVSFFPYLLFTREYWKSLLLTASAAVGYASLVLAMIGFVMVKNNLLRSILLGLLVGYVVLCLAFTYHVRFTRHYHTQLIIIVALASAPLVALIIDHIGAVTQKWHRWLPFLGALALVLVLNIRQVRQELGGTRKFLDPQIAQEIGDTVSHSTRTAYVAPFYGAPLEYYAELSGTYWPRRTTNLDWVRDRVQIRTDRTEKGFLLRARDRVLWRPEERELSIDERLGALGFLPEYFVITDLERFDRHHADLEEFLVGNCQLIAENEQYLIYGNCTY
jgi:hypothetical protein